MPTTNGNMPISSPMTIDRRELVRSGQRGVSDTGPSAFSDALGALGTVAEGVAPLTGRSVVQTAISTGGQILSNGPSVSAQGGARTLGLGRIPDVPNMPNINGSGPASGGDYNTQMAEFSNQQMQMTMLLQKTQNESLHWQTLTNIIKTQHETAMNAVRNLKS